MKKILDYDWSVSYGLQLTTAALRYSLPALKIYNARYVINFIYKLLIFPIINFPLL